MELYAVIDQVTALLQQRRRLAYRALQYQFHLDAEGLEALKAELIDVQALAEDQDGKMLVWKEGRGTGSAPSEARGSSPPAPPPPVTYTPSHLAEPTRAEQAALEARSGTDGERKTITALFADLKGSTALIKGLDPE